jgi:hypothetical protein
MPDNAGALLQPACHVSPALTSLTHRGAIQSDAALRQSIEPRQMAAATLSVGVLLAILEAAREIRVPFASTVITVASSEGNLKEAAVIETSHVTKNPQRECITLDCTRARS